MVLGKWNGQPLEDPADDYSGAGRTPRYYVLESGRQKQARDPSLKVAIDDWYGVVDEDEARDVVPEWRVPG